MGFVETMTAISAGLDSAGTATGGIGGLFGNRNAHKWNKRWFEEVTLPQWQRETAWAEKVNSPAYKVAQLRAAGMNPHLASGLGTTASSGGASISRMANQTDFSGFVGLGSAGQRGIAAYLQVKQAQKNLDLTDQQIRKASADADVARQMADGNYGTHRANSVAQSIEVAGYKIAEMQSNVALRNQQAQKIVREFQLLDSRLQVNEAQISKILSDIDINAVRQSLMRSQIAVNQGRITLQEAQEEAIWVGLSETAARTTLLHIQADWERRGASGSPLALIAKSLYSLLGR